MQPAESLETFQPVMQSPNETPIDGIEILVDLAKTGKIDPWDINIVKVTDQFLAALADLKSHDLKLTGKTLLFAAILLRMKSDALSGINFLEIPTDEAAFDDDPDFFETGNGSRPLPNWSPIEQIKRTFHRLDEALLRRTSVKEPRNRRVTLNDLIAELQKYEELEKKRRLKQTIEKAEARRVRSYENFSAEDIVELAHEEFIEDTVFRLHEILMGYFLEDKAISLTQLETEGGIDRVSAFIAVLFLTARGEADLYQEQFYEELYICPEGSELLQANDIDDQPEGVAA